MEGTYYECLGVKPTLEILTNLDEILKIGKLLELVNSGKLFNEKDIDVISENIKANAKECYVWIEGNISFKRMGSPIANIFLSFKDNNSELNAQLENFRFSFGSRNGYEDVIPEHQHYKYLFSYFMERYNKHIMRDCNYIELRGTVFEDETGRRFIALSSR